MALFYFFIKFLIGQSPYDTVKAIILTRRIYNDFLKLTGLCEQKVTILTHSQRSIATVLYRFLYNDFYSNDRFPLVNSLELALRYIYYGFYSILLRVEKELTQQLTNSNSITGYDKSYLEVHWH